MAAHPTTSRRSPSRREPSFCKRSSPDYDPDRCRRFKARRRRGDQESTKVQSILFDRGRFNSSQARAWLKRNGFKSGKLDETENELRFRQRDPGQFKIFRRKELAPGVSAVVAR